jgi:hypothetical protein
MDGDNATTPVTQALFFGFYFFKLLYLLALFLNCLCEVKAYAGVNQFFYILVCH